MHSVSPAVFKRQAVSTVRKFPRGCGRRQGQESSGLTDRHQSSDDRTNLPSTSGPKFVQRNLSVVRTFPRGCSRQCHKPSKSNNLAHSEGESRSRNSKDLQKLQSSDPSEPAGPGISGKGAMPTKLAPPKRRSISAVRKFPNGCGRNLPDVGMKASAAN